MCSRNFAEAFEFERNRERTGLLDSPICRLKSNLTGTGAGVHHVHPWLVAQANAAQKGRIWFLQSSGRSRGFRTRRFAPARGIRRGRLRSDARRAAAIRATPI